MNNIIIDKNISRKVIMTGVAYENNHPGGISAVVQYWANYIEDLQYIPTFKEGSILTKIFIYIRAIFVFSLKIKRDNTIKILHAHTAAGNDFGRTAKLVEIAKKKGLKVIIHCHASSFKDYYGEAKEKKKEWIKGVLLKADVLIALSESWKKYFISIGVNESKIMILHNITAYPHFITISKNEGKVRLLFMGEIGQRKGVFDLLKAIGDHREELKDKIELRIGGNKMEDKLLAAIRDYRLENFVRFEGFVSGEKKIELLNWANVFVLPSFNEGLPISILEAMSYRMPIISTPVGGIPEVVDEKNGKLVTPGNDKQIYEAIREYVDNGSLIKQQGDVSFKKVETYLPEYVLNHLKTIYEGLFS